MKVVNEFFRKVLDIRFYKISFLIGCFLYTFPFTAVIMSKLFKIFLVWPLIIIGYDYLKKRKYGLNKNGYLLLLMIIIALGGCFWNYKANFSSNIIGVSYLFIQTICMLIYDKSNTSENVIKEIQRVSKVVVIITFICSILSIIIYLFNIKLSIYNGYHEVLIGVFEGRLWSIYGNPNTLGHLSLCSIWFSCILLEISKFLKSSKVKKLKFFTYANIIIQWICILLSNSRSTMIAFFISFIILFVFYVSNKHKEKNESVYHRLKINKVKTLECLLIYIGLVIITSLILKYCLPLISVSIKIINTNIQNIIVIENSTTEKNNLIVNNNEILKEEISKVERETLTSDMSNGRFEIWSGAFKVFLKNPILGVGIKNVNDNINQYMSEETVTLSPKMAENTHNIFLQILVSHGIIVFSLFILFLIITILKTIKFLLKYNKLNNNKYNIILLQFIILVSLLLINLFDSNMLYFFSLFIVPIFWICLCNMERLIELEKEDATKKDILFLIDSLKEGGAEKVLTDMINNLDYTKYNIEVRTIYNEGSYIKELNNKIKYSSVIKIPNIWIKRIINRLIKYLPSRIIYDLFINKTYDIEIAFLEYLSTKVLTGSNSSALKIAWIHTDIFEHKNGTSLFKNKKSLIKSYQKFNKIVCVSETTREKFCKETFLYQDTITIYNPIDKDKILKKAKEKCNEKKEKFIIVTIGRLNFHKGYLRLCEVIKNLKKDYNDFVLWIIGEGEERKNLEKYIKENELQNYIKLLGFKSNPYQYLKEADLFISSSFVEGYSLVLAEALILEIPVLSTKTAGPIDILDNGKYGMLVENSKEGIYNGLKEIFDNKNILKDLKNKAVLRKDFFNIKKTIDEMDKLFDYKNKVNKNNDLFCSVFTPTYNRAYLLERLYTSLKEQEFKDFEWIVVDDGSTDDTEKLFKKWLNEKNEFQITYLKVENGGKQRAVNKGIDLAKGKMFFIVDSDDYLDKCALKKIFEFEKSINEYENYAGISGFKGYNQKKPIGKKMKKQYIDCSNNLRKENNLLGDKAEVYYTDVLKRYKFPEIDGEKFISESVVWNKIGNDNYKIRWFNDIIYYCDYLEDGLTKQGMNLYKNNPIGYLIFIRNTINYTNTSIIERLQHYYGYYDAVKDIYSLEEIASNLQINKLTLRVTLLIKKIKEMVKGQK